MDPQDWLQNALDELLSLASVAEDDPDDAWRAVVLMARLLASPSGPTPPAEVLRRLPALLACAGLPEPEPLLERLSAELAAEDDPAGPLLDVLIDIDDGLSVLSLYGDAVSARSLSQRASEIIARSASRVGPLKDFAVLRRATVRPDSEVAALWGTVAHSPAESRPVQSQKEPVPTVWRWPVMVPLPREAIRPHAWTPSAPLLLSSQDGEVRAWLYEEKGRLRLEVRGPSIPPTRARLVVLRRDDAVEQAATDLPLEVSGNTAYADLGPVVGQGNLLHALLVRAGLPQEEADLGLMVMHDD